MTHNLSGTSWAAFRHKLAQRSGDNANWGSFFWAKLLRGRRKVQLVVAAVRASVLGGSALWVMTKAVTTCWTVGALRQTCGIADYTVQEIFGTRRSEHFSEPTSMCGQVLLSKKHHRERNTFCTWSAKARQINIRLACRWRGTACSSQTAATCPNNCVFAHTAAGK